MRHIPLLSIKRRTGVSLRLFRRSASLLLLFPGIVLTAVQLCAQAPTAYTAKELLATDPRVFTGWLETHRPPLVSPGQKARILEALPSKGEITSLDDAGRQKLAALKQLLQAVDRESEYEVKVTDVAYARIVVFERSVILISKSALMLLDADDLQALVAHEIGHEYFTVEYASAFTSRDHRRLKDLELLCDAIAIVTVHRLGMNPARLLDAVEKITRYNQKLYPTRIDGTNYPTIAERRSFARKVTAWLEAAGVAADDLVRIRELVQSKVYVRWRPSGASADPQSSSRGPKASESHSGYDHRRREQFLGQSRLVSPPSDTRSVHIWCEHLT